MRPLSLLFLYLLLSPLLPHTATGQSSRWTDDNWHSGSGINGTDGDIRTAAWHEGRLYVAGSFRHAGGKSADGMAVWDGEEWQPFGGLIQGEIETILIVGSTLYVGGNFSTIGSIETRDIARYDLATGTWSSLGNGIGGIPNSTIFTLAHDGKHLYAGGSFVVAGTTVAVNVAAWDGTAWHRVGTGADRTVQALHVHGDYLYAGGEFSIAGDSAIDRLARFSKSTRTWERIPGIDFAESDLVAAITSDDDYLYIGGRFSRDFGASFNNVARLALENDTWDGMENGVTNSRKINITTLSFGPRNQLPVVVQTLALRGDDLMIGGDFDNIVSDPRINDIDAANQPRDLALWNRRSASWSMLPRTSTMTGKAYASSGPVNLSRTVGTSAEFSSIYPRDDQTTRVLTIAPAGGDSVFIGGRFDVAGPIYVHVDVGSIPSRIEPDDEAVLASNIALLSERDTTWSAPGAGGFDGEVHALADDGRYTYAAGTFRRVGNLAVRRIARLDRESGGWGDLGGGVSGSTDSVTHVAALEAFNGNLFVGGNFTRAGEVAATGLARWDPEIEDWSQVAARSFTYVTGMDSNDSILAVVGRHGLSLWDGEFWVDIPEAVDGVLLDVEIDGANIYVGGSFTMIGEDSASNVAVYNRETELWGTMQGGVPDTVFAIEAWEGSIYVGGSFNFFGSQDLIRWNQTATYWERVGSGFLSPGTNDEGGIYALESTSEGLFVGGQFLGYGNGPVTNRASSIAMWNGTVWRTMGSGVGRLQLPPAIYALESIDDRLCVGGVFELAGTVGAAGYAEWLYSSEPDDAPGSLSNNLRDRTVATHHLATTPEDAAWDDRFNPDRLLPGLDGEVFALAADSLHGRIYAGGGFTRGGTVPLSSIGYWDGTEWNDMGSGVDGFVFALTIIGDSLWVGGQFEHAGGVEARNVACYDLASETWSPVANGVGSPKGVSAFVSDIVAGEDGVYVGGLFQQAGDAPAASIARYVDGQWHRIGEGIAGTVNAMTFFEGSLFVGGSFGQAGGVPASNVARRHEGTWHAVEGGVNGVVNDFEVWSGQLLVGGRFTGQEEGKNLMLWVAQALYPYAHQTEGLTEIREMISLNNTLFIGGSFEFEPDPTHPYQKLDVGLLKNVGRKTRTPEGYAPWLPMGGGVDGPVNAMAILDGNLLVGGAFAHADTIGAEGIAGWSVSGRTWYPLSPPHPLGRISTIVLRGDTLYGAGHFVVDADSITVEPAERLARLDSADWNPLPGIVRGDVGTIALDGETTLLGGSFVTAGGVIAVNIVERKQSTGRWSAPLPGSGVASLDDISHVFSIAADAEYLYVAGTFDVVDTFETGNIARFNRSTAAWEPLGEGLDGPVYDVAIGRDGSIYATGDFLGSGEVRLNGIAIWKENAWHPLGEGIRGQGRSLTIDGTTLYVGGTFDRAGEIAARNVASWNIETGKWSPLGEGLHSDVLPGVEDLLVVDGRLFAAGFFNHSGADSIYNVARYDETGWEPLGSGVDFVAYSLAGNSRDLYIVGSFSRAGSKPSPYIALWHDPTLSVEYVETPVAGSLTSGPNPVIAETLIRYAIPQRDVVHLSILDLGGREIITLHDGPLSSGEHQVRWVPEGGLPAGVYVVRMVTSAGVVSQKVVVY